MNRSLLLVFAHPDDESYSAAGTIARYARDGRTRVTVATLTRGEASRHLPSLGISAEELGRRRSAEVREAVRLLGSEARHVQYEFPDGGLRHVDPREIEARLTRLVREVRPDVIVTFDVNGISGHPDHTVATACVNRVYVREREGEGGPRRLAYLVVRAEDVEGWNRLLHTARPGDVDVVIDCREYFEARRAALEAHRSVRGDIERDNAGDRLMRREECYTLYAEPVEGTLDDLFSGLDGPDGGR